MRIQLLFIIALSFFSCQTPNQEEPAATPEIETQKPLTVFLVRHAEKASDSSDPSLTEAGKDRAMTLAHSLSNANIGQVHSTDYGRTRETAMPTSHRLGLETALYDPRDLPTFAQQLLAAGGKHLVVGHSNTTPQLVQLLGGEPGTDIHEEEYDRLYILTVAANGDVNTVLLRYGIPYIFDE